MFKRGMIFLLFLLLTLFVYLRGEALPLAYLVFYPLLIFPIFYFFDTRDRWFVALVIGVAVVLFLIAFYRLTPFQALFLGGISALVLAALIFYRMQWVSFLRFQKSKEVEIKKEFNDLQGKYETRLDSLHRLEKQVASLMELFEIARDFSGCLSFEEMMKLIRERILPELPFEKMDFLILSNAQELKVSKHYQIGVAQIKEEEPEYLPEEIKIFERVYESKQMHKESLKSQKGDQAERWVFPLAFEGRVRAIISVEGANPEDIVRFEVLVAHLILQVKKIQLYETVRELSIVDGLTGLYVRRHFLERFDEELERSIKFNLPLAVLMLDIDHFKRYNDQFGHLVGDATLKEVAGLLRENLRKVDIVARYGGEEFIAVLPETTEQGASEVAERVRSSIARHHFKVYDVEAKVTVSLGVSLFPSDLSEQQKKMFYPDMGFDLVRHADKALYRAKEEGRNRVYRYNEL